MSTNERTSFLEMEVDRLTKELSLKNREIDVEITLEKIRVKALDMRSSSELKETSTILFQQLKELKINAIRTGIGIFDDENNAIELWITSVSDDGRLFFILDYINVQVHPVFENIVEARESLQPFVLTILEGANQFQYYKTMSTFIDILSWKENMASEFFYSFFFSAGTINVVANKELTSEETDIMIRLASVFGLMYTRFLDLKKSEEQAVLINEEKKILELTLENLKVTQKQLIQSEKMASLGELTAGIAHEIQNPLNFVNNFSEVNKELLTEMNEELDKGNYADVKAIAKDVIENEEKINHHGKRADAIVKGMLLHSRRSTGVKEATDINALCDEYLRLSYHGLRAKDKSFNANFETNFDSNIGKVNVVAQDIGRVILNLFTNAFYVVDEKKKKKSHPAGYEPTVSIHTQKNAENITISISDNGNGMPEEIKDKIFQPFFTTKPTGKGTGLGLSLSFDIVKAHNGTLTVSSSEGIGTTFTIKLPNPKS